MREVAVSLKLKYNKQIIILCLTEDGVGNDQESLCLLLVVLVLLA